MKMIEDIMQSPMFWILGGGAIAMELLGWMIGKNTMGYAFPIWQLLVLMLGTLVAAAYFALQD